MQIKHTQRLLDKQSNNNFHGLPKYLDHFKFKSKDNLEKMAKSILDDSYDFQKEQDRWQKLMNTAKSYDKEANSFKNQCSSGYPGEEAVIAHLEQTADFEYVRTPKKKYYIPQVTLEDLGGPAPLLSDKQKSSSKND